MSPRWKPVKTTLKTLGAVIAIAVIVFLLLIALAAHERVWGAPLLETTFDADGCQGTFMVGPGVAKSWYWLNGHDGAVAALYADSLGRGRHLMLEHDGDWVACAVALPESCAWNVGPGTAILLTLANGTEALSTTIVVTDDASGVREAQAWSSAEGYFQVSRGCPYWRRQGRIDQVRLWVRFPEGSVLRDTDNGDDTKPFRSKPVRVQIIDEGR